jgi:hypothetical protein
MGKINENKLFNEMLKDMNKCGNYYQFLLLMQSKYNMNEDDVKKSGLDKVWRKEKHDRPDYYPGEPEPINEDTLRKIIREALEEISWNTAMKAGETSDELSMDLNRLGNAAINFANAITEFEIHGNGRSSYENIVEKYDLFNLERHLDRLSWCLFGMAKKKGVQSDYFKTSTTDAEEHYLNKNGVITNFDDIEV